MVRFKYYPWILTAAISILLPACSALSPKQAVLPPVGPAPAGPTSQRDNGFLVVYSAWSHFVDQGSTAHHSRYLLTDAAGRQIREVINHADRFDEGPLRVALPPGSYHIRARSAHFGRVTVPVVVKPRLTTFVYLDGSAHPDLSAPQQANAVKLPDGEMVGWSSP
jgi:hypothetical protein